MTEFLSQILEVAISVALSLVGVALETDTAKDDAAMTLALQPAAYDYASTSFNVELEPARLCENDIQFETDMPVFVGLQS